MKIKEILSQYRRDFTAILECEHCGKTEKLTTGYDDDNYHQNAIPSLKCPSCGQTAPASYRPLATQHPAETTI